MRQHLKHIKTTRKRLVDGSTRVHYYHRKTNKKIDGELGTPEFLSNYIKACEPTKGRPLAGTFHALVEGYFNSSAFGRLKPRTQQDYRKKSSIVLDRFANAPFVVLDDIRIRSDIRKWRDVLAQTSPRQADYALAFLSCVLSYGCDQGDLSFNHAKGIKGVYKADRSEKIWEQQDIDAFLSHANPEIALAMCLALETGQRQGDLIKLTWAQLKGDVIEIRQGKTNRLVSVPCTHVLMEALSNAPKRAVTILTGRRGLPWTSDGFRTEWHKTSAAAGTQGRLTFHDLRGTAITRLANAGCTIPEIAAISGHSTGYVTSIVDAYMARTPSMGRNAISKLESSRRQNKT